MKKVKHGLQLIMVLRGQVQGMRSEYLLFTKQLLRRSERALPSIQQTDGDG